MDRFEVAKKLMSCFPNSFVNQSGEFIAHRRANEYFILENCETELDVKCKVLEWFSRGAYKTTPFSRAIENTRLHIFMLEGINRFLETKFDADDMELIYGRLGNCCNHALTIEFVESGYNMELLAYPEAADACPLTGCGDKEV